MPLRSGLAAGSPGLLDPGGEKNGTTNWLRRQVKLLGCCVAVLGIAVTAVTVLVNRDSCSVDFNQYYAAGKLAGTGHLYDWPAIQALELQHNNTAVPYGRLPVYALVFKIFSILPYPLARWLFLFVEIAAIAGFVVLWPFTHRNWLWLALCWSAPLAICLALGQDSVLFLFFVALGFRLLRDKHDLWAGVAFAVCASKPHIAALLPVVLAAQSRWKALSGGITGGAAIVGASFAAEGPEWPQRLLALTRLPDFDPAGIRMPNLRGLLTYFNAGLGVELVLTVAAAVGIFFLCRRLPLKHAMAVALAGGVLLSHHAYVYDCVLLLPAVALAFEEPCPDWLRTWAKLMFTPMPYILLMTDMQLAGHLAVTGYTLALLVTMGYGLRAGAPWFQPFERQMAGDTV